MADFGDLLFQAEKLANDLDGSAELPRVERNLRQVLEASNELYSRVAQTGAQDIQANLLLGSKGIDLPQISQKLEALVTRKTFEPLEPVADSDISTFVKNEREAAIMSIIEEIHKQTDLTAEDKKWLDTDEDWEKEKRKLLNAMIAPSEMFIDLDKAKLPTLLPEKPSPAMLSYEELAFAKQIAEYNKFIVQGSARPSLVQIFSQVADEFKDSKVTEMWEIMKYMLEIPPLPRNTDPIKSRATPAVICSLINQAKKYLENRYKLYMNTIINDNLHQAKRGGVPGTYPLVKSFVSIRFHGDYLGLQDGRIDDRPLWPMVYFCLRAGDYGAALHCVRQASAGFEEIVSLLDEHANGPDDKRLTKLESEVKFQYRRSVRNSTDPFKRIVYCILGVCDIADEHSEVAKSVDDYLWLKLSLIRENVKGEKLGYADLQTTIIEEYGESHYQAHKQPHLYFQVLALTGQFEAAIEFLSRFDRYKVHAVHMGIILHEFFLLGLSRTVTAPLLIVDPEDPEPARRINFARLIMIYVRNFEITHPAEALQYYYLLRTIPTQDKGNLFAECVSDLALECRDYELIFGKILPNGARVKGLIDQFNSPQINYITVSEILGRKLEQKGLFENAVKIYDIAQRREKVLALMSTMLSQVVHQTPMIGSTRERLQILAAEIADRYSVDMFKCNATIAANFYILKDLLQFFDYFHSHEYVLAMETLEKLQLIPLSNEEIDVKVSNFKILGSEVCKVMPDILIAAMTIIHQEYKNLQGTDSAKLQDLRNKAKTITSFAGTIPYRLPGDTNSRLVQMEILMH